MNNRQTLKAAFPHTIPVLTGYLFLGMAFGILLQSKGYNALWALGMSIVIYAGAMQFVAVELLVSPFSLLGAAIVTLVVNARHIFYGFSLLGKFSGIKKEKPYIIFGLTDETFSLHCSVKPPPKADPGRFYFCITLLDHLYWIAGCVLGALLGAVLPFDTTGVDFVMTALFVVIFVEQWRHKENRIPSLIGIGGTALCLMLLGPDRFILPAMLVLVLALTAVRGTLEGGMEP